MAVRTFAPIIHKEEDLYVAQCPEVGTVSQGESVEKALLNLREATELYLEEFPLPDAGRPLLTTFEVKHRGMGTRA
jgi:predicted RNase H-like HicB family nuclease